MSPTTTRSSTPSATPRRKFGKTACLVNNAGLADAREFKQVEPSAFAHEIDVNLKGVLNGTKAVLADMSARGSGTIFNISSVSDRKTAPVAVTYTATKYGVRAFSKLLQQAEGKNGVRVINVAPGYIRTNIHAGMGITFERIPQGAGQSRLPCRPRSWPTSCSIAGSCRRTSASGTSRSRRPARRSSELPIVLCRALPDRAGRGDRAAPAIGSGRGGDAARGPFAVAGPVWSRAPATSWDRRSTGYSGRAIDRYGSRRWFPASGRGPRPGGSDGIAAWTMVAPAELGAGDRRSDHGRRRCAGRAAARSSWHSSPSRKVGRYLAVIAVTLGLF